MFCCLGFNNKILSLSRKFESRGKYNEKSNIIYSPTSLTEITTTILKHTFPNFLPKWTFWSQRRKCRCNNHTGDNHEVIKPG